MTHNEVTIKKRGRHYEAREHVEGEVAYGEGKTPESALHAEERKEKKIEKKKHEHKLLGRLRKLV